MNLHVGQTWLRRPLTTEQNMYLNNEKLHVVLAYLGDNRFFSITAAGDLFVWPSGSDGPDWTQWEQIA